MVDLKISVGGVLNSAYLFCHVSKCRGLNFINADARSTSDIVRSDSVSMQTANNEFSGGHEWTVR